MRALALLTLAAVLAGCTTTTRVVDRTDVAAVAGAHAALAGQIARIDLVSGESLEGRVAFVRMDSTAWTDDAAIQTVPTAGVAAVVVDTRGRSVGRGALIGTGVGLALGLVALATVDQEPDDLGAVIEGAFTGFFALAAAPVGAFYGTVGGAIVGRRVEVVFTGSPPGPPR